MYHMKSIIDLSEEIALPKCMYHVRNPNETLHEINLNIRNQVMKFHKEPNTKMSQLEHRQEVLIEKLDILYNRIKTISSYCNTQNTNERKVYNATVSVPAPEEVVLVVDPDNLPWFLNKILNDSSTILNFSWHIHSSVSNEKVPKIKEFGNGLKYSANESKTNIRLIFCNVSTNSELKLSSLGVSIVGTVNILRYLSYIFPNAIPYDDTDYQMDSLLDMCHMIEKSSDKRKENLIKQLFLKCKDWIYDNKYSVVDLAAYNVIKQTKGGIKLIPKQWFDKCEKMCA